IGDANLRMEIYRRIAAGSESEDELIAELEDRFGKPPLEVAELMGVAAVRRHAEALRIQSITGGRGRLRVRFRHDTKVSAETLIRLVGAEPDASFSPNGILTLDGLRSGAWVEATRQLLERLSA
ncbi:MAG: hypothetical protein OEM62_07310, partial [Acidobacteriota bacterium]|nr:hypothetical protein [Acidobacteriota bacterium]